MPIKVVFLHGLESGPAGSKAQRLGSNPRYTVTAPELPTRAAIDFLAGGGAALPVAIAQGPSTVALKAIREAQPDVVVGSSFGGGIATQLAAQGSYDGPLVLLAPAGTKLFGVSALPKRTGQVVILHGRDDDVVPHEDSVQLAAGSTCDIILWLVDDDHRLKASVDAGAMDDAIAMALGRRA